MDILNGDRFYGHYIFYRLLPIDWHEFSHNYHFKVLNALSPFTILPYTVAWNALYVSPHCFMYRLLHMFCQKWRNKDVQSIKLDGQHPMIIVISHLVRKSWTLQREMRVQGTEINLKAIPGEKIEYTKIPFVIACISKLKVTKYFSARHFCYMFHCHSKRPYLKQVIPISWLKVPPSSNDGLMVKC